MEADLAVQRAALHPPLCADRQLALPAATLAEGKPVQVADSRRNRLARAGTRGHAVRSERQPPRVHLLACQRAARGCPVVAGQLACQRIQQLRRQRPLPHARLDGVGGAPLLADCGPVAQHQQALASLQLLRARQLLRRRCGATRLLFACQRIRTVSRRWQQEQPLPARKLRELPTEPPQDLADGRVGAYLDGHAAVRGGRRSVAGAAAEGHAYRAGHRSRGRRDCEACCRTQAGRVPLSSFVLRVVVPSASRRRLQVGTGVILPNQAPDLTPRSP